MSKNSDDRKRKTQLAEKKKRLAQGDESLAYMGMKYKKEKFIPALMHAEIGIYQAYVITDRKLVDQTVKSALENLIRQMRHGALPALENPSEIHYDVGQEEDLVIASIRRNWAKHFISAWKPPQDDLTGILRTILGSLETMRSAGAQSQSFLTHIAQFLTKKLGVVVQSMPEPMDRPSLPEPSPEQATDEIVLLGRQWNIDGKQAARAEFFELATHLVKTGQADRVLNACQLLLGEMYDSSPAMVGELLNLKRQARGALTTTST